MQSIADRIASADSELLAIKERCESKDPQIMAIRDDAFDVLEKFGLVTPIRKPISRVGFHPRNRGKRGLTPSEVPKKVDKFMTSGFSASVLKPITIQRIPGQIGDDYEASNIELCNAPCSKGMLAPVVGGALDSYTLTCNHSWQALKLAALSNCEQHKLNHMAYAIEHGLDVRELPYQLEVEHGWLIELIIEADNVPQGIVVHDGVIDMCFKISNLACVLKLSDGSPNWDAVDMRARRSETNRPDDIPALINFVRSSCMGPSTLLANVDRYSKRLQIVQDVPAAVLAKFSSIYLGASGCPLWREAVFKACMRAPTRYIVNGINTYITQNDVLSMGKNPVLKLVMSAEVILEQARAITSDACGDADDKADLFDTLGMRLAAHIAKRPILGDFKSMVSIAGTWYRDLTLVNKGPLKTALPSGWKAPQNDSVVTKSSKKVNGSSVTGISMLPGVATAEQIIAHLAANNIETGSSVTEAVSQRHFKVTSIDAMLIKLISITDGTESSSPPTEFLTMYCLAKAHKEEASSFFKHIYLYI